ncbi:MAG: hypothetical protein MJH10_14080 [Epibacterium sp.]|nr:hypothetical protein [Epibacterium sp.]NQX74659.1 hypothetical protein [Epibacterium sp.]
MSSILWAFQYVWNSKWLRSLVGGAAAILFLIGSVLWLRDDAADDREQEIRDENAKNVLKQRLEIQESQDEQAKEADDIRRGAEPSDDLPEWMRANPETD